MIPTIRSLVILQIVFFGGIAGTSSSCSILEAAGQEHQAGRVTSVTLYRGQALVTRAVKIAGEEGGKELVVTDLPNNILGDSLFAEGTGVDVRAVRFRTRAVGEEPRLEIRKLDEHIAQIQTEILRVQQTQKLLQQRMTYLDNLEKFVAGTGKTDLARGVLDAESLEKITVFTFEQRGQVLEQNLKLSEDLKKLDDELSLANRKRNELTGGHSRMIREAVVFLHKRGAGDAELKLNYLVQGAGWSPAYNLRAGKAGEVVQVEYNAIINQMTGEDWSDVELTLSTASPALSAACPGLAPFRVSLSNPAGNPQRKPDFMPLRQYGLSNQQLLAAARGQNTSWRLDRNREANWQMNDAINGICFVELTTGKDELRQLQLDMLQAAQEPSISYQIGTTVSLASRSDQQMVRISELSLPTELYHVATPVLSGYVYREAEIRNTGENDLLSGPVTVYLNGRFVGRTELPTVARGQTFVVGLGADSQLRTRRELVERTETAQGGNREISFEYRLVLENYKPNDVKIRVMDRIPFAERGNDIRVTLGQLPKKLSGDKTYVQIERSKGILRWDVEVPASTAGDSAYVLNYDFKLEFDRKFSLATNLGSKATPLQREFELIQEQRAVK